jgi:hypothetical protein
VERIVMIARLKPNARDRARELIEQAGEDVSIEFDRQAIFLAEGEVIFFCEGPDAEATARSILNDPARSTAIGPWLPLLDGPLHAAPEAYYRERG